MKVIFLDFDGVITQYVVIDDITDLSPIPSQNQVVIENGLRFGIQEHHADLAISILNEYDGATK